VKSVDGSAGIAGVSTKNGSIEQVEPAQYSHAFPDNNIPGIYGARVKVS
jgi:hypothetical protein